MLLRQKKIPVEVSKSVDKSGLEPETPRNQRHAKRM